MKFQAFSWYKSWIRSSDEKRLIVTNFHLKRLSMFWCLLFNSKASLMLLRCLFSYCNTFYRWKKKSGWNSRQQKPNPKNWRNKKENSKSRYTVINIKVKIKIEVKSPYIMHASVARNSHLNNKPEADLALISPPLSTSALHFKGI